MLPQIFPDSTELPLRESLRPSSKIDSLKAGKNILAAKEVTQPLISF